MPLFKLTFDENLFDKLFMISKLVNNTYRFFLPFKSSAKLNRNDDRNKDERLPLSCLGRHSFTTQFYLLITYCRSEVLLREYLLLAESNTQKIALVCLVRTSLSLIAVCEDGLVKRSC